MNNLNILLAWSQSKNPSYSEFQQACMLESVNIYLLQGCFVIFLPFIYWSHETDFLLIENEELIKLNNSS